MDELTYAEHVKAKRKALIHEYTSTVHKHIRNITLSKDDLSIDGFLSNHFFAKKDISDYKKLLLKDITVDYKKRYGKLLDTLRT